MKTYLLKYLKANTHTFYDIVLSKDEIEARERISKELDPEKKRKIVSSEDEKRFIHMREDIIIFPGVNEISEDHYRLLKEHKTFSANGSSVSTLDLMIESRPPSIEWVRGFSPEDDKDKTMKEFSSLKEIDALNIVESMWKQPMIEKYLAGEKREKVKAALEAQLDKLKVKSVKAA